MKKPTSGNSSSNHNTDIESGLRQVPLEDTKWINKLEHRLQVADAELTKTVWGNPYPTSGMSFQGDRGVKVVPIGPYLRPDETGEAIYFFNTAYKWRYVCFSSRILGLDWRAFLEEIKSKESELRGWYESELPRQMDAQQFAEMLLLDSVFVLFALVSLGGPSWNDGETKRCTNAEYRTLQMDLTTRKLDVQLDLLTLGNQIPLSVMYDLLKFIQLRDIVDTTSLKVGALAIFQDVQPKQQQDPLVNQIPDCHHLLHLFHWSRIAPNSVLHNDVETSTALLRVPSATELQESGTFFRKMPPNRSGSHGITFKRPMIKLGAIIGVPPVYVNEYSNTVFHNLVAFEQSYRGSGYFFTSYATCVAHLLRNEKDARLLQRNGIIENVMRHDDYAVQFFRHLGSRTEHSLKPRDLYMLYEQVWEHHERPENRLFGDFLFQYCSNPWISISVIGAIMLFVLTFLQTVYAILSYKAVLKP